MSFSSAQILQIVQIAAGIWAVLFGGRAIYDLIKKIKVKRSVLLNVGLAIVVLGTATVIRYFFLPAVPPTGFTVTTLKAGQVIQNQNTPDSALTIQGTYASEGSGLMWVVLQDKLGQYYLQNPPVSFLDGGKWVANNILIGKDITRIDFVVVTDWGNFTFQQMVMNNQFGAFNMLPEGSQILRSIPITSVVSP